MKRLAGPLHGGFFVREHQPANLVMGVRKKNKLAARKPAGEPPNGSGTFVASSTPPELASRWRVSADKVLGFIRRGELRAINLATLLGGRPRYRIIAEDAIAFEERRAVKQTPPTQRRRRRSSQVTEFF